MKWLVSKLAWCGFRYEPSGCLRGYLFCSKVLISFTEGFKVSNLKRSFVLLDNRILVVNQLEAFELAKSGRLFLGIFPNYI